MRRLRRHPIGREQGVRDGGRGEIGKRRGEPRLATSGNPSFLRVNKLPHSLMAARIRLCRQQRDAGRAPSGSAAACRRRAMSDAGRSLKARLASPCAVRPLLVCGYGSADVACADTTRRNRQAARQASPCKRRRPFVPQGKQAAALPEASCRSLDLVTDARARGPRWRDLLCLGPRSRSLAGRVVWLGRSVP